MLERGTKIINMNRFLKPMITVPVREVAIDLEYITYPSLNQQYEVMEIALHDIGSNKCIYQSYLKVSDPSYLPKWKKDHGYTEEKLRNGKSKEEVEEVLKVLLSNSIAIFWNADTDLKYFPFSKYSLGVRCCMKRYAERYGDYSEIYGDHKWSKLKVAAEEVGLKLDHEDFFHCARTDAKTTAQIWSFLESKENTKHQYSDLVLRSDLLKIEREYEKKLQDQAKEISNLKLIKAGIEESDDDSDIPF